MALLYTKNREEDLVNMIAAEVSRKDEIASLSGSSISNALQLTLTSLICLGPRWNSKLHKADGTLHLQAQQGWN